ncbi:PREDICTED: uncharacterized protein LOC109351591 isoform X1 [Lupinus angustifolius]|uniref:uncharacterized protein LOC109351591 isoform X1 n=1 Tax=Lupinus angustifolius TaxID=3871 RepID=UPI00092ECE47|nr:PREDICTED: uncharacterized protein LOC109351591 isoform X1 [Lupinus angustifolius]XP_019448645.1 PREDICTED: uncharacterized protein LOC109351591 isoform X1 [Lupinus angustifolius]
MALNKARNLLGTNTGKDHSLLPPFSNATGQCVHNDISVWEEEEFYVPFGNNGIASRRVPASPERYRKHEDRFGLNRENGHVKYEGLTKILGLRRMESESSEISDFISSMKEPTQEMENGAFVNSISKSNKEAGDSHTSRKVIGELISDISGHRPIVSPCAQYEYESTYSDDHSGSGVFDDYRPEKMKFLCSFGGKVLPRPSDGKLRYVGGQTHMISIRKDISWEALVKKTSGICNQPHTIKYQLPGEDLDALISVSSDEDLQNMIEEYYGLERHEGSQRHRIFLVPLGESEETSSFEASNIQQSDPGYQYVVAVNGITDPIHGKSIGGHCSTNEASQLDTSLNLAPSPISPYPLDAKGGGNALNPNGTFNDSLNLHRPHIQSPLISPIRIEGRGSSIGYTQLLANNSCQGSTESNTSFVTAQLQPENSSISTADRRYSQQVPVTLLSNSLLNQHNDVRKLEKHYEQHIGNYNPDKETVTPLYVNPSDGYSDKFFSKRPLHKERIPLSGNPPSRVDDPIRQHAESDGTTFSPFGMPHAFSDSQLHECETRSGYCSQEGTGLSFSLDQAKAPSSSMLHSSVSQRNILEIHNDSILLYPQIQSKITNNIHSSELHRRHDVASSFPYSESPGMNGLVHSDSILIEKKYPVAQTNLSGSSFVVKHAEENSLTSEMIKRIEEKNPTETKESKIYEGEASSDHRVHVTELNLLDSFPSNNLNAKVNMQKDRELHPKDRVAVSLGTMGVCMNNHADKIPYHLLDTSQKTSDGKKCAVAEGLNGEQGTDFSLTRNSDLNSSTFKCGETSSDKTSLGDMFELSINLDPCKAPHVHPSVNLKGAGLHENPTLSSASLYPAVLKDGPGPSSILSMNHQPIPKMNIDHDLITSSDQMVDRVTSGHFAEKSKAGDVMSEQSRRSEKHNDVNQVEPFSAIEDMISIAPPDIDSSLTITPKIVDENGSRVVSLSPTEEESIIRESEPEDFKDDESDRNEFLTDAMIAEMEASIYGLQIIRNDDLEELQELGSGTYGTVYHGKWRGSDIAIKRIKKSCFAGRYSEQERLTKDFWREAQILSNLHHPNVVAFYGIVPDGSGGTLATVTEYMVNGSLRHVLITKDRLLDHRKKLAIAMDAAFGMEYLHSKNIVHFDLKCDNLLVNLRDPQRPVCKVGDFGLSRIKRNTLVSGGVRGTLPWMAPELLNGSSSRVSEKVDVFSFGISMWEILTGEEPYADMHCGAIIGGIVKNTLRPPIPEHCDAEWRKLMEECWSRNPESRPSFTEITRRLRSMFMTLQAKGLSGMSVKV